ncbi:hypothetical protein DH2020_034771 [Rehmannia glutinosa]|uniref:UTP-monosaccharide-1-phosphate uridylyltransferase n=1 Tax=Rehmannia glutinosa TaxID=99300 RepID=A0ABR0VC36_REHGL
MATSTTRSTVDALSKLSIDDWASTAPNLRKNLSLLSPQQLAKMLLEMNQSHLFEHLPEPGVEDDEKREFFDQVARLHASYPGGLASYIKTARNFWQIQRLGKTHMMDLLLLGNLVPSGETLTFGDDNFIQYEEAGVREARKAAFVLVAGGLGERLGYNGIKVALPIESTTGTCFLQHYIESILALQETSSRLAQGEGPTEIPLAIMTSDDTHSRTIQLLETNAYFGMKPSQIKLLKQEKVACLDDNDARLAVDPNNKYKIQAWCWSKWVLFFQDTNGLLFKAIPSALGVSAIKEYHVNSLAVPRKAKEAIGGITRLTHQDGRRTMVINVEYNQLDPLLRATGIQMVMSTVKQAIRLSWKHKPNTKILPKPLQIIYDLNVMDTWFAYAPVKNNPEDAAKVPKGNPYHSATSGEMAIYRANSLILRKAGVKVDDPVQQVFNGQEVDVWPRIVWKPKWGLTYSDIKSKVSGNCSITGNSTITIKGQSIYLEDLALDGALVIDAVDGAEVKVGGSVQNAGWIIENVDFKDTSLPEEVRIRGFKINKVEQLEKTYKEPGKYSL